MAKRTMLATTALACAVATPAYAQQQPTAAPATEGAQAAGDGDNVIIVQARRRDELLEDVPGSVSAITEAQLLTRSNERLEDFLRQTPSATVVFAGPEYLRDVSIRGQGGGRNGFSDASTGLYRNGIFVAGGGFGGRTFNALDLFDVGSFEVYRGPQGALYGRNAVGGAVNIITNQPTRGTGGSVQIGYDERQRLSGEARVNLGLGDFGAIRVGATGFDQNDGFFTSALTGEPLDTSDFLGLRIAARLFDIAGFSATATYELSRADAPGFSSLGQRTAVPSRPTAAFDPDIELRNASRAGRVEIDEDTFFVNVDGAIGATDVALVFTHKTRDAVRFNEDLDHFIGFQGIGGSDLIVEQSEDFERTGVELRFTSQADGPLTWLVGVDWQDLSSEVATENSGVTAVAALREQATRSDFSTDNYVSYSAFGSLEYKITPALALAFEGRVQRDERDFDFQRVDRAPTPVNTSIAPLTLSASETRFTPGATVKWSFADDSQAYLRLASAYRPAGFNIGTNNFDAIPYRAETGYGAELGLKLPLVDGLRASLSAYYLLLDDAQVVTTVSATDTTVVLQNIPDAQYGGLELELNGSWQLGPGRLSIDASAATQFGEFGDGSFITVNGTVFDVSGEQANRVRDFIGNFTTTYDVRFNDSLSGFFTATINGENGGFENAVGALDVPNVSRILEGFALLSLRAGVRFDGFTLSAFANNITDERYIQQNVQGNNFFNEGRVFGVNLRAQFGARR